MPFLIRGTLISFPKLGDLQIDHDHLLVIDSTGHITHNAPYSSPSSRSIVSNIHNDLEVFEVPKGSFLLPTFTDLHLHAPQFLYQGTGLHLPLMQWLDKYAFKAEERMDASATEEGDGGNSELGLARRVYAALAKRLILGGTGAVLLFGTIGIETNLILAETMQRAGVRAFVGKLSMDIDIAHRPSYVESSPSAALSSASSFVHRCREITASLPPHRRLVHPALTPRFVPTCSDELLKGLGELAAADKEGLRIQSHLAEARDQVDWVRRERGKEDIEVFDQHNLLTPRTIQAHCTFLPPPSLSLLSTRGTSIAHCPLSNAYFSAQPFPLKEALQRGVNVGLGTDVAGGYDADLMGAMRWAVGVARMREGARGESEQKKEKEGEVGNVLDWKGSLYLATRGGSEALGLGPHAGTFEVGAAFDAQQIRIFDQKNLTGAGNLDLFDLKTESDVNLEMVEKWWCIGDVRNRVGMWVQGEQIMKEGIILSL